MAERYYTDDQAQEILRMAARTAIGSDAISRRQLLETAAELGISPEDVLHAENLFNEQQELEADRKAFRKFKQRELFGGISKWLSVAFLLYGIVFVLKGFDPHVLITAWPRWPIGIWGLVVLKDAIEVILDMTVNREAAFERWRSKKAKKLEAKIENNLESATPQVIHSTDEAGAVERNQARS